MSLLPTVAKSDDRGAAPTTRHRARINPWLVLAGLVLALLPVATWVASQIPAVMTMAWTTAGPDFAQTTTTQQAARACMRGLPEYNEDACQLYTQTSAGNGLARFPTEQGGSCTLSTRFDCAQAAHLEQWPQDVPWWRPWDLHNGAPGMWVNGLVGALGGLALAGLLSLLGAHRATWLQLAGWAAGGGALGLVLMDLVRHQDDPTTSLPSRYLLMAMVLGCAAIASPIRRRAAR